MRRPKNYTCFAELAKTEKQGIDYRIHSKTRASGIVVIAPHGGRIEPGTMEIACAVAGSDHSFYGFEGIKPKGNRRLHIPSIHFDEPVCRRLVAASEIVVAIHGCRGKKPVVHVGGLHVKMKKVLGRSLRQNGFDVDVSPSVRYGGVHPDNICNRGANPNGGVQVELSRGLREKLIGSREPSGPLLLHIFVDAFRKALHERYSLQR